MPYVIGIDEAGRGALAGPVCVGAVIIPTNFDWEEAFSLIRTRGEVRLRDSKKLSASQREVLFAFIHNHPSVRHAAAFVDARTIDAVGIVPAVREATTQAIASLNADPVTAHVELDAGLQAPPVWQQESHVRGDEKIPAIALASIVAKVSRDALMEKIAPQYASYDFEVHKGYGTLAHRSAIQKYGLSDIHRASFCTRLQK